LNAFVIACTILEDAAPKNYLVPWRQMKTTEERLNLGSSLKLARHVICIYDDE
jgi:hypothetical protein